MSNFEVPGHKVGTPPSMAYKVSMTRAGQGMIQGETGAQTKSHLVWWYTCKSLVNLQNLFFEGSLKLNHINM